MIDWIEKDKKQLRPACYPKSHANMLAFSPPLSINEDEVDEIAKRLGAAMDGVS